jgi:YbbR domain-containing protein
MDRFLHNSNVVKLIAFILAIILWFAVGPVGESTVGTTTAYSKSVTGIPVKIISDEDQIVESQSVAKVNAILTGGTFDLTQLQASFLSIKAVADIRGDSSGTHEVPLTLQNVPDTLHYQIIPDTISVTIEKKQSKTVSIKVGVMGQAGQGFVADSPIVSSSTTTVYGPEEAVNQVASVQAVVSIDHAQKTIQENVALIPVDQSGKQVDGVELSNKNVFVKVPIHSPTKDVLLQAVTNGNVKNGYLIDQIQINPDHATVTGPMDVLGKMESTYSLPPIDVTGLDHDKTFTIQLQKPQGAIDISPQSVNVTVKIVKAQSSVFTVPVTLANIPDGMNATIQGSQTVDVTVSGDANKISQLRSDSIKITADLTGLAAGTHTVQLKSNVPDGFQVVDIAPAAISVSIAPK